MAATFKEEDFSLDAHVRTTLMFNRDSLPSRMTAHTFDIEVDQSHAADQRPPHHHPRHHDVPIYQHSALCNEIRTLLNDTFLRRVHLHLTDRSRAQLAWCEHCFAKNCYDDRIKAALGKSQNSEMDNDIDLLIEQTSPKTTRLAALAMLLLNEGDVIDAILNSFYPDDDIGATDCFRCAGTAGRTDEKALMDFLLKVNAGVDDDGGAQDTTMHRHHHHKDTLHDYSSHDSSHACACGCTRFPALAVLSVDQTRRLESMTRDFACGCLLVKSALKR